MFYYFAALKWQDAGMVQKGCDEGNRLAVKG